MRFTEHELRDHAGFINDSSFRLNSCQFPSAPGDIRLGFHELPRRSGEAHLHPSFTIRSPGPSWRRTGAANCPCRKSASDCSDYDGIISLFEPLVGKSAWLTLSSFTVDSLDQAEDPLILSAVTDNGTPLDDECASGLFTFPGQVIGPCLSIAPTTVEASIHWRQAG